MNTLQTIANAGDLRTLAFLDLTPRTVADVFAQLRKDRLANLLNTADEAAIYHYIYQARERVLCKENLSVAQVIVLYAIGKSVEIEAAYERDLDALLADDSLRGEAFRVAEARVAKRRRYARRKLREQTGRDWDTNYWADYADRWH